MENDILSTYIKCYKTKRKIESKVETIKNLQNGQNINHRQISETSNNWKEFTNLAEFHSKLDIINNFISYEVHPSLTKSKDNFSNCYTYMDISQDLTNSLVCIGGYGYYYKTFNKTSEKKYKKVYVKKKFDEIIHVAKIIQNYALIGNNFGSINLICLNNGEKAKNYIGHGEFPILSLDLRPEMYASGGMDTNAFIWDYNRESCLRIFSSHDDIVNCVKFKKNTSLLATTSDDSTLRLWDIRTANTVRLCSNFEYKKNKPIVWCDFINENVMYSDIYGNVIIEDLRTNKICGKMDFSFKIRDKNHNYTLFKNETHNTKMMCSSGNLIKLFEVKLQNFSFTSRYLFKHSHFVNKLIFKHNTLNIISISQTTKI
ncbi:hypothetical protein A3Q56_05467 [Intoshia linei]|uniref:Uncharacterized protein n=1 Tax=Intoshia linei TaxID=1819745 RepID=A0A177AZK4_9BILA|nr:hypothetical protein A3Q56_05467 [Intoshia linei]